MVTRRPLACNNFASDAATIPFPNDEVTPPVTKINLAIKKIKGYEQNSSIKKKTCLCCMNLKKIILIELTDMTWWKLSSGRSCKPTRFFFKRKKCFQFCRTTGDRP